MNDARQNIASSVRAIILAALLLLACCRIFSVHAGENNLWVKVQGGDWHPNTAEISELQSALPVFVKKEALTRDKTLRPWKEYTFQYQGRKENGRDFIYVNAFCQMLAPLKLEKEWVLVLDGGSCYFELKYDPLKNEFFEFGMNGEA